MTEPTRTRRLTVRQAADEWQISTDRVRVAIKEGKLVAIWAGTGYRMLASDVEAWVKAEWGRKAGQSKPIPRAAKARTDQS